MNTATEPIHLQTSSSAVKCGFPMRHWRDQPVGWDLGTCTVSPHKVTCAQCLGPPAVSTVADLTNGHKGWLVRVPDTNPVIAHRTFTLVKVRSWTNSDGPQVGIQTTEGIGEGWAGTEHMYPADTPCELLRKTRIGSRRRSS